MTEAEYRERVLPRLANVGLKELAELMGVSRGYAALVKRGNEALAPTGGRPRLTSSRLTGEHHGRSGAGGLADVLRDVTEKDMAALTSFPLFGGPCPPRHRLRLSCGRESLPGAEESSRGNYLWR